MTLADYGYRESIQSYVNEQGINGFTVGRVISEQKERYCVFTDSKEYEAEIAGNLRFSARGREDFPAVGDWVLVTLQDKEFAVINSILPRYSAIKRRAVGRLGETQVIAANIDYAMIVVAAGRDFNFNRIERYLTICNDAKCKPIIVVTKIDLLSEGEISELERGILKRLKNILVLLLSNETLSGIAVLREKIARGSTYCMLGSSGVGKSSLLNNLCGKEVMKTGNISSITSKGRHITSYRELVVLDGGGILIDNPGMREVGIADNDSGIDKTFDTINTIAQYCKYSDCTHSHEIGCAVLAAVKNGEIEQEEYDNYRKLEKEKAHYSSTKAEIHRKDKDFGKMLKKFNRDKKSNIF